MLRGKLDLEEQKRMVSPDDLLSNWLRGYNEPSPISYPEAV